MKRNVATRVEANGVRPVNDRDTINPLVRSMRRSDLTAGEREIARILITDYPEAALLSARALARAAAVSPPTVSRFATKLGYASFQELHEAMRLDLRARLSSPSQRLQGRTAANPVAHDLLREVVELDVNNLQRSLAQVDPGDFDRLVARLRTTTGSVYVMGSKKGAVPARYLYIQLNQVRQGVRLLDGGDGLTDELIDVGPKDLLVAFAPRRPTARLIEAVREFRRQGAPVAGVCDQFPPPELADVEHLITVSTRGRSVFDSYTAFITLVNGIVAALVSGLGSRSQSRIKRVDALTETFAIWAPGIGRKRRIAEQEDREDDNDRRRTPYKLGS